MWPRSLTEHFLHGREGEYDRPKSGLFQNQFNSINNIISTDRRQPPTAKGFLSMKGVEHHPTQKPISSQTVFTQPPPQSAPLNNQGFTTLNTARLGESLLLLLLLPLSCRKQNESLLANRSIPYVGMHLWVQVQPRDLRPPKLYLHLLRRQRMESSLLRRERSRVQDPSPTRQTT